MSRVRRAPSRTCADLASVIERVESANQLQFEGKAEEAQSEYDAALDCYLRSGTADDSNALVLKFTKAQSFLRQGGLESAKELLLEICRASAHSAGMADERTQVYLNSLAATLVRLGEFAAAKSIVVPTLELQVSKCVLGCEPGILSTASVLVTQYLNAGDWVAALPVQEALVALLKQVRGGDDVETLLASSLLGVMFVEADQLAEARHCLQITLQPFSECFGREHAETSRLCLLLGLVLEKQGDLLGAKAVLERSYAIANEQLDSEVAIRLGTKLAGVLIRLEQYIDARTLLTGILPACERLSGDDSALTLTNMNNLAVAMWRQGERQSAFCLAGEVARKKRACLGDGHSETEEAQRQVSAMANELGKQSELEDQPFETVHMEEQVQIAQSTAILRMRGFQIPGWKQ